MALERDVYRSIKDIVGEGNISEDPATLNAYAYHFEFGRCPLAEAVVLPASTEEIQAIVRICNKQGQVRIDLCRHRMIVAGSEVNITSQLPGFAPDDEADLGVGL